MVLVQVYKSRSILTSFSSLIIITFLYTTFRRCFDTLMDESSVPNEPCFKGCTEIGTERNNNVCITCNNVDPADTRSTSPGFLQ